MAFSARRSGSDCDPFDSPEKFETVLLSLAITSRYAQRLALATCCFRESQQRLQDATGKGTPSKPRSADCRFRRPTRPLDWREKDFARSAEDVARVLAAPLQHTAESALWKCEHVNARPSPFQASPRIRVALLKRAHHCVMTSNPKFMCGKSCVAWGCVPLVCRKSLTASDIYPADCRLTGQCALILGLGDRVRGRC